MAGMGNTRVEDLDLSTTPFCGCGKCLVGLIRLSSLTDTTDSPEKQVHHCREEAKKNGGHIIGWAIDLDVSGATNPFDRKGIGPWLKNAKGPYDGIVASAVDRIGRNLVDVLMVGYFMRDARKLVITRGHQGPWNLNDQIDEQAFTFQAMGAQMELRAIQRRTSDTAERMREKGRKYSRLAYGYRYVFAIVGQGERRVEDIEIDREAATVLCTVVARLLSDKTGRITYSTEAKRLTAEGVPSPNDHRAITHGRKPKGGVWTPKTLREMLLSEAALGYLMHDGKPLIDSNNPDEKKRGRPIRIAPELWNRSTHDKLVEKLARKRSNAGRAPKSDAMCIGCAFCGQCRERLFIQHCAKPNGSVLRTYCCKGRAKGVPVSATCKPAPAISITKLDAMVERRFLETVGNLPRYELFYDGGSDVSARLAEVKAERQRLRDDRNAGLYNSAEDAAWFQDQYKKLTRELDELKSKPQRPAGTYWRPTGKTVADEWKAATTNEERRELLANYEFRIQVWPNSADRAERVVIDNLDASTEDDIRRDSWEAYQLMIETEMQFRAQAEADQDAAEALAAEDDEDVYVPPTIAELIAQQVSYATAELVQALVA